MKGYSLVLIAGLGGLMVHAQTNPPGAPPAPSVPILIHADSADFDLSGHQVIHHRHVRVDDPQMKLTCEQLVADLPPAGGRPNHIVAETNVVIDFTDTKGQTNHATGDKAVYVYSEQGGVTNKTVTLTGNPQPQLENAQGLQVSDVIIWSRENTNSHLRFIGNYHMVSYQKTGEVMMGTNSPVTVVKTNIPPGTIENVDKNISNPVNRSPKF
jgi:lipopolysaccharide export system protein LptA